MLQSYLPISQQVSLVELVVHTKEKVKRYKALLLEHFDALAQRKKIKPFTAKGWPILPLLNNSKELELLYIRDFGRKENFKNLDFENATTNLLKIYSKFNHESDNLKNIFEKKKDIFNIVDAHVKEKNANLTERIISNTDLKYLVKVILFDSFVGRQDVQMFHTGGKRFHNIKLFKIWT